jgi:hypothetical protein
MSPRDTEIPWYDTDDNIRDIMGRNPNAVNPGGGFHTGHLTHGDKKIYRNRKNSIPVYSEKIIQTGYNKLRVTVKPAITTETMVISLIRILSEGPDVSLKGSPTVSPTTPAWWASLPLPP